jgi:hypothetical protein
MTNCELTKRIELLRTIEMLRFIKLAHEEEEINLLGDSVETALTKDYNVLGELTFKDIKRAAYEKVIQLEQELTKSLTKND